MFDIIAFILGKKQGERHVEIDGENITCTDDGNGNIIIEEADNGE